jgi:hypothetical protein
VTAATEETKECPVCNGLAIAFCSGPCFGTGRVPATHPELLKAGERRTTNASISEAMRQGEERLAGHLAKIGTLADSLRTSAEDERVVDELMGKREVVVKPMKPSEVPSIANLEMRRDAVMHAIRNSPSHLPNEALWELGRDLTRKLRAATDPFTPHVEDVARFVDSLPPATSEPAGTIRQICISCGGEDGKHKVSVDKPPCWVCPGYVAQSDRGGPSDEELIEVAQSWVPGGHVERDWAPVLRALYMAGRASREGETAEMRALFGREIERRVGEERENSRHNARLYIDQIRRANIAEDRAASLEVEIASLTAELKEANYWRKRWSDDYTALAQKRDIPWAEKRAALDTIEKLEEQVASLTTDLSESKQARDSAIERAGAMDVRVAELSDLLDTANKRGDGFRALYNEDTSRIHELEAALRMCLAELDCHEWLGPKGGCISCMRDDHDENCSHVEAVTAGRKALGETS